MISNYELGSIHNYIFDTCADYAAPYPMGCGFGCRQGVQYPYSLHSVRWVGSGVGRVCVVRVGIRIFCGQMAICGERVGVCK